MDNYAGAKLSVFSMLLDYHRGIEGHPTGLELAEQASEIVNSWVDTGEKGGENVVPFEVH